MQRDPDLIVDRTKEIHRLESLLSRGSPQLVLMYGRRRVGKTYLLGRVWKDVSSFYFTASETTPAQNREALLRAFAEWSGNEIYTEDYPTWRSIFRLLLDHNLPGPLAITLDEFQYLGENEKDLNTVASELNAAWEMRRPNRPLVFVIAGSAVRKLEGLNHGGSPLYGRFAWQCRLRPLDYWHAGELAGFETARDRAAAYGVFGGTPRYLAAIDPELSLEENIISLILDPSGEVRELIQTALLREQGLREIPKYIAILRSIGHGRTELNEIAQASGLERDSSLRDKIDRLIGLDYVRADRNLGAKRTSPYRYRIADPAMRFFYDFVAPLENALAMQNPAAIWQKHIAPAFDTYMGHLFETIAEEAYFRLQETLDLPLVAEWGRWEGVDSTRAPLEIDIASILVDKRVLTGAIKWNRKPIDVEVHNQHLSMLARLAESGVAWAHKALDPSSPLLYLASGGFTERFRRAAEASRDEVFLWNLDDIYREI